MDDLKLIKRYYGETMMNLCKESFPTILEIPGKLFSILETEFNYSKFLGSDIINNDLKINFINYINSKINNDFILTETNKTPEELMDEAGYILYECTTENEIQ